MEGEKAVLFLLGAGASVDSGMKTYRGGADTGAYYSFSSVEDDAERNPLHESALRNSFRLSRMWDHLMPIVRDIPDKVGPMYERIKEIAAGFSQHMIATQNIDGLAHKISDNVVELHGDLKTVQCLECWEYTPLVRDDVEDSPPPCQRCGSLSVRPDIVLFGETLPDGRLERVYQFISQHRPTVCYVIGTSLRFPYLQALIKRVKKEGCQSANVIHVNPDPTYSYHTHRERWDLSSISGELTLKRIRKRKPETLLTSL
jgi:NAD-dependent SIR2 family protein deacetylase